MVYNKVSSIVTSYEKQYSLLIMSLFDSPKVHTMRIKGAFTAFLQLLHNHLIFTYIIRRRHIRVNSEFPGGLIRRWCLAVLIILIPA